MRSNIARTCESCSVPDRAEAEGMSAPEPALAGAADAATTTAGAAAAVLLTAERGEEVDQRGLLVLRHTGEGGHRSRRVVQRAADGARKQLVADLRQPRPGAVIAVLADLVAGQAAGLCDDELAGLELRRDLHVDLVRRAGRSAQEGEVSHGGDREDAGDCGDRAPLGPPLRAAVVERQQDQQDDADR